MNRKHDPDEADEQAGRNGMTACFWDLKLIHRDRKPLSPGVTRLREAMHLRVKPGMREGHPDPRVACLLTSR